MNGYGLTDNLVVKAGTVLREMKTDALVYFDVDTAARFGIMRMVVRKLVTNPWTNQERMAPVAEKWAVIRIVTGPNAGRCFDCSAVEASK